MLFRFGGVLEYFVMNDARLCIQLFILLPQNVSVVEFCHSVKKLFLDLVWDFKLVNLVRVVNQNSSRHARQ